MRLPKGGRIDRSTPLRFTVDGNDYTGYQGDTVASALIANGVLQVAPSIYRQRPRGIVAAGVEEPNALVQLHGTGSEPMLPATTVEVYDGLAASLLPGNGRLEDAQDTAGYDRKYTHCDVLIVGGGPAGLSAALATGRTRARVILVDEQNELGGSLLSGRETTWVEEVCAALAALPEIQVLTRSTVFGYYDHNYLLAVERRTDHLGLEPMPGISRQRVWHIRAKRVVLATGAHERPVVFADNDRPGVMLAGAVRTYVNRYAALPGRRAVVFTTNDSAYHTAFDLAAAGADVAAVVDIRGEPSVKLAEQASTLGIDVLPGSVMIGSDGAPCVNAVHVAALDNLAAAREIRCDLLAVSGGWNPVVHLFSQSQGTLRYDEHLAAFVPDRSAQAVCTAGAARGVFDHADCVADGQAAGVEAARLAGFVAAVVDPPRRPPYEITPVWAVPGDPTVQFVDLQRDATVADIHRATGAGMRSVEHVKRYTTIGTGNDQGKTSGVVAIGAVAEALCGSIAEMGTTTFRPPYTPVSFASLAGRDRGRLFDPVRTTAIHGWHVKHGAVFEDVGQWKRPRYYPRPGEDMDAAVLRECRAAREAIAVMDASTLGKIEIQGPHAEEFLDRIYTNDIATIPVGSCRYGLLCKTDGMVFNDGVVMRLAADRFLATTTTSGAAAVLDWFEEWLQTEWHELRVYCTSVSEQWATIAAVGPEARTVLAAVAPGLDESVDAFPFMTWRDTTLASGIPARIARVSFSGELAYEVNVPSWHGRAAWEQMIAAGSTHDITPYGTEAMRVLRAEKGYIIVGQDTDGAVTPQDLGMDWAVSKSNDFVGKRSHRRTDTARAERKHLVGLLPTDPTQLLPEGAQLVTEGTPLDQVPVPRIGHVTSSYRSAALDRTFALALIENGRNRIGQTVLAPLANRTLTATISEPTLYDPDGAHRDG